MSYPFYFIFGVLPSFVWLLFYLRKDRHPESRKQVLKVFSLGMLVAVPAVFLEIGAFKIFGGFNLSRVLTDVLNIFVGVALVEEFLKYAVVRYQAINHHEFDEPVDAMIYMIIAALGFAAVENILILFQLGPGFLWGRALEISVFRFLGATFLHVLTSALIGYFLAAAICQRKKWFRQILVGLGISSLLHGLYNFSIMKIDNDFKLLIPIIILFSLAIFVSWGFRKLQKMKSVCLPDGSQV